MTALDRQIDAAERRLQARRTAWATDVSAIRRRVRDAASSPIALLTAVAVGFGVHHLRTRPESRPPAAGRSCSDGVHPLVLLVDALNIAGTLLALRSRSSSAPPRERSST